MDIYESRTGLGDMTSTLPFPFQLRSPQAGDRAGAYAVCLKTGNFGQDGEPFYRDDPEALGRVFVGPYLDYEPELARILEDDQGICGYVLAAMDSHAFYARYEAEWRPELCRAYPAPTGDPGGWNRVQQIHHVYHHPDYFCPEPYDQYPSHVHIDLLPRAGSSDDGGSAGVAASARITGSAPWGEFAQHPGSGVLPKAGISAAHPGRGGDGWLPVFGSPIEWSHACLE
jgi:hypothetical protein